MYDGLSATLLVLGLLLTAIWQAGMLVNGYGMLTSQQILIFFFYVLGWIVLASMAVFFASFSSYAVALFSSLGGWVLGLSSSNISKTISNESEALKQFIEQLAMFWNLQRFNLGDFAASTHFPSYGQLVYFAIYGVSIIAVFTTAGSFIFSSRDVVK